MGSFEQIWLVSCANSPLAINYNFWYPLIKIVLFLENILYVSLYLVITNSYVLCMVSLVQMVNTSSSISFILWYSHQYHNFCYSWVHLVIFSSLIVLGRHCCLFCTISKEEMKIPLQNRTKSPARTLDSLARDYQKFCLLGSNIKNAKECNNVIDNYMFNIPIEQVFQK